MYNPSQKKAHYSNCFNVQYEIFCEGSLRVDYFLCLSLLRLFLRLCFAILALLFFFTDAISIVLLKPKTQFKLISK